MSYSMSDVPDWVVDRCIEQHHEVHSDCAACPARLDERLCARCDTEVWPHETCPTCPGDLPALVVDGFGNAVLTLQPDEGVAAA